MTDSTDRAAGEVGRRRLVVSRALVDGVLTDTLSCGHTVRDWRHSRTRYCDACAWGEGVVPAPKQRREFDMMGTITSWERAAPAGGDGLTEIGRILLRLLPPPGEPFPPERRAAYLATARALFEDTWGGRDGDY